MWWAAGSDSSRRDLDWELGMENRRGILWCNESEKKTSGDNLMARGWAEKDARMKTKIKEIKGTRDPVEHGKRTTEMTDGEKGSRGDRKRGLLTPEYCWGVKISMQKGWRGESFMKNEVETEGKSCKWKYIRGERSCQNTVKLFIFCHSYLVHSWSCNFESYYFCAPQQLRLPSNGWLCWLCCTELVAA